MLYYVPINVEWEQLVRGKQLQKYDLDLSRNVRNVSLKFLTYSSHTKVENVSQMLLDLCLIVYHTHNNSVIYQFFEKCSMHWNEKLYCLDCKHNEMFNMSCNNRADAGIGGVSFHSFASASESETLL